LDDLWAQWSMIKRAHSPSYQQPVCVTDEYCDTVN
jgi:hypothetical protein